MKRILFSIILVGTCFFATAQARINFYGSYVFDDHFEAYADTYTYYEGTIKGGFQWGAGIEYSVRPEYSIELLYYRLDTEAPSTWRNGQIGQVTSEPLQVAQNYIMLGGNRHLLLKEGKVETYAGFLLGMAIYDISNESANRSESLTKFAWGLRAGVNIWATEKVGIKLQAQLLSAVQAAGGGAYFGTGGAGVGVSTYSTIYQFGLGGGIALKMGQQE